MRRIGLTLIGLVVVAGVAFGQDGQNGPNQRRGGNRGGFDRGRGWDRGAWMDRFLQHMQQEVGLTDDQMSQAREILTSNQAPSEDDRARWQEMRDAMQNGDHDRVAQLRDQMMAQRDQREAQMEKSLDQVAGLLNEDQLASYNTFRDQMNQRREEGRRRGETFRTVFNLPDTLNMSDDQRDQFRALLDQRREAMRQQWQDRRDAAQSGETDGATRGPGGPGGPGFNFFDEAFFNSVNDLLDDGQRAQFAQIRAQLQSGGQGAAPADHGRDSHRELDMRTLLEASRRVPNLTADQRDQLKQVSTEAMRAYREFRGENDKEGMTLLTSQTKTEIEKILTDEQIAAFQARLDRERGGRDHRRTDRSRSRRGGAQQGGHRQGADNGGDQQPKKSAGKRGRP